MAAKGHTKGLFEVNNAMFTEFIREVFWGPIRGMGKPWCTGARGE